ncbi:MAG: glycine rich domain-containing protein [Clostridia bacterium]
MNENLRSKRGVSLSALIISIIIALILISVSIVVVKNSIDNAALTTFADDISSISEATTNYYITEDEFPALEGTAALSQVQMLSLAQNSQTLINEMKTNQDYIEDTTNPDLPGAYYMIDLAKINVVKSVRGMKAAGVENDIYVVAYPSMNVYYLKGFVNKKKTYYGLSEDLINQSKINVVKGQDSSSTTVQSVDGLIIKKQNKKWTNKLGINVSTDMASTDKLYISLIGGQLKEITPRQSNSFPVGKTTFTLNNLRDAILAKDSETVKISSLTMQEEATFQAVSQDLKYVEIVKHKNGQEVARIKVSLSNYESEIPSKTTDINIQAKEDSTWVDFKVEDTKSGIKEVRYDYLKKFNENGEVQNYYTGVNELDEGYMKTRAKKATVSDTGYVQMKIPKNIEGIQIMVRDSAGNWINMTKSLYEGGRMYVGFIPKDISVTKATFTLVINSTLGVSNANTSISVNGTDFITKKEFNPNTKTNITKIEVDDYTNIVDGNGQIYIKAVAINNDSNVNARKTETSIQKLTKENNQVVWDFDYTGNIQTFYVPKTAKYKVELWGASGEGGGATGGGVPGKGAYTKGIITLNKGSALYIVVGNTCGYNGNSMTGVTTGKNFAGGATDVRLVSGSEDNFDSLKSRVMVASSGGAASHGGSGAPGGTINGIKGIPTTDPAYSGADCSGNGATQTSGGKAGYFLWHSTSPTDGTFGKGGNGTGTYGGAGGSGYYGGGGAGIESLGKAGGGSGNSYISGYPGCNAISSNSSSENIVHTGNPIHYSGLAFDSYEMLSGADNMPNPRTSGYSIGNLGNGFAKITKIQTIEE